ncbi:hypothetical protein FE848_05345 [Marinobacter sp. 1-3A]|uniref:hypothetical protein n=1 Tax=Marinobacter sp. 1-3A TaxID=2582920 RepID=UPI0019056CA2|nr:hypothetical protein [Marinobacter sp. 1-3A]MBK1872642.1 hypothetical protein [Marinobacter sp. 1-3A]
MKHFNLKVSAISLALALFAGGVLAQGGAAEDLVAGMERADMTYRQLMEVMGGASGMMHEGILRQNPQMVKSGADIILTHPAPSHQPWSIMPEDRQADFKWSLVSFDKLLDQHSEATVEAAAKKDWLKASQSLQELNTACISCHSMWKDEVK